MTDFLTAAGIDADEISAAYDRQLAEIEAAGREHVLNGATQTTIYYEAGHSDRLKAMATAMYWQTACMAHDDDDGFRADAVAAFDQAGRLGLLAC